jgi:hypothetical protein
LENHRKNKKGSEQPEPFFEFNPGGDLRSRVVSSAVSSARQGLTSVFGMGTGVTLAVRPPGNLCIETGDRNSNRGAKAAARTEIQSFNEQLKEVGNNKPQIRLIVVNAKSASFLRAFLRGDGLGKFYG